MALCKMFRNCGFLLVLSDLFYIVNVFINPYRKGPNCISHILLTELIIISDKVNNILCGTGNKMFDWIYLSSNSRRKSTCFIPSIGINSTHGTLFTDKNPLSFDRTLYVSVGLKLWAPH